MYFKGEIEKAMSPNPDIKSQNATLTGVSKVLDDQLALVVLGMHRSGTSMLSGMMGILGGQLPMNPGTPAADNMTGFWEPRKVVSAHERLFDRIGIQNDTPMMGQIGDEGILGLLDSTGTAKEWIRELSDCVREEFGVDHSRMIVLKDPRMCRLMPLWKLVFDELKISPSVLIPVRHPLEIAASLQSRNGFDEGRSMWLWLDHVLRAEYETRGTPRMFVRYTDILNDWRNVLGGVGEHLGLDLEIEQCGAEVDRFVSAEHWHHRVEDSGSNPMPKIVTDTYSLLGRVIDQTNSSFEDEFDDLRSRFEEVRGLSSGWIDQAEGRARSSFADAQEGDAMLTLANKKIQQIETKSELQAAESAAIENDLNATIDQKINQIAQLRVKADQQADRMTKVEKELCQSNSELAQTHSDLSQKSLELHQSLVEREQIQDQLAQASTANDELSERNSQQGKKIDHAEVHLHALRLRRQWLESEYSRHLSYIDSLHTSGSWRLTAPLRIVSSSLKKLVIKTVRLVSRSVEQAGKMVKHRVPMSSKTEWALERVFYRVTKPVLRQTIGYSNHQQRLRFKNESASSAAVDKAQDSSTEEVQLIDVDRVPEAVVVFGVIDWFFRFQRPQHLAEQLARRGHRVFYISPQFVNTPKPGYDEDLITPDKNDPESKVHQIRFHVKGTPPIYNCDLTKAQQDQIVAGLRTMLLHFGIGRAFTMVQHPAWLDVAASIPNAQMIYDCMDHHDGFDNTSSELPDYEDRLIGHADLTVVTSNWLREYAEPNANRVSVIRNACDYEHFAAAADDSKSIKKASRGIVIGYFGAVAEWFDADLVRKIAQQYPDATVLIAGADSCGASEKLSDIPNIQMKGEMPYSDLPELVRSMDVCLIPFVLSDLILATNPVKVYEMLAAGKPVVSTDLPELRLKELDGLVYLAGSHDEFLEKIEEALGSRNNKSLRRKRQDYAAQNRWSDRSEALDAELALLRAPGESDSLVSVIVVTWNNLDLTKACVESILADDSYQSFELIVVDNASTDGTTEYLTELESSQENVRIVLSQENTGFARGNNIGLKEARGEYLILLNNDTVVTHGWIRTFVNHLRMNPDVGLLGPITNNIGNEARVQTRYQEIDEMPGEVFRITRSQAGELFDMPVAAFFCCIFSRSVFEEVGMLDEKFGLGYFEDDDYCQRVRECGYRICCANDVFVHHHLSAGFKLIDSSKRDALFAKNLKYYESKWGTWSPHRYRVNDESDADNETEGRAMQPASTKS